jgi:hypothetical protein
MVQKNIKDLSSSYHDWIHLGAILPGHYPSQLQSSGGMIPSLSNLCRTSFFYKVNFFVGLSGLSQLGRIAQYVNYLPSRSYLPLTGCF